MQRIFAKPFKIRINSHAVSGEPRNATVNFDPDVSDIRIRSAYVLLRYAGKLASFNRNIADEIYNMSGNACYKLFNVYFMMRTSFSVGGRQRQRLTSSNTAKSEVVPRTAAVRRRRR